MLVRTDDEIYRVDSVWLGPPRATFPWRARYVSYGLGLLVMIIVMFVQRRVGIGLDFFSVAWALLITVGITRFLGKRIDDERPLGQVATLFRHEVSAPRRRTAISGGELRSGHVRVGSVVRPRAARKQDKGKGAPRIQPAGAPVAAGLDTPKQPTRKPVPLPQPERKQKPGRRTVLGSRKGRSRVTR